MKAHWMKAGMILALVIVLVGVSRVYADKQQLKSESERTQLEALIHTGHLAMDKADRMIVKWQGQGKGNAQTAAFALSRQLGLPEPEQTIQTGHEVYRSERQGGGLQAGVLVNAAVVDEGEYYLIVQLTGDEKSDMNAFLSLHEKVGHLLNEAGLQAAWNFAMQGSTPAEAASQTDAGEQLEQAERAIASRFDFHEAERYADNGTVAVSYEAPGLPLSIASASRELNMQLAVHVDQNREENRITVGFPVITIEY